MISIYFSYHFDMTHVRHSSKMIRMIRSRVTGSVIEYNRVEDTYVGNGAKMTTELTKLCSWYHSISPLPVFLFADMIPQKILLFM